MWRDCFFREAPHFCLAKVGEQKRKEEETGVWDNIYGIYILYNIYILAGMGKVC